MSPSQRQPAIYIPHGGGPWPFMESPRAPAQAMAPLTDYLRGLVRDLSPAPRAVLVVSAHWEAPVATLMTHPHPPMLYDYYGFPPNTYTLQWPAPTASFLVERVTGLLAGAGLAHASDPQRGFDHGTFVPMMLALPEADLPVLQVSLLQSMDAGAHLALGRALAPLRDEGVLLVGSGNSYHNMRGFGQPSSLEPSRRFDAWLAEAVVQPGAERERRLADWAAAPGARHCHPREEHLLPLHVMAGAAAGDAATLPLRMEVLHTCATAVRFG